ncbi:alpha/beta fold hydrolase [Desulfatibacillum aliphaticivorans]|uniref:alpha/beta fold hydrolase n=1 Tax=Desulfatibacillum aliphaticivorans TaxID=218208 RepID=UPI000484D8DF|nr:alpha/beta fold hydrolase [Desulfatibacillum aliphaticivorans]
MLFWPKQETVLVDRGAPKAPHFLMAQDLFARKGSRELFIKKIFSAKAGIRRRGPVILCPGIATNANLFRMDDQGGFLSLGNNRSFATYLASEGFTVYCFHPGYAQRVYNRYVVRHCRQSMFYGKMRTTPPTLDFVELVDREVPMVIERVRRDSGSSNISWVGYSLGGMMMYTYLAKTLDATVRNVVTIGSPITLHQIFVRIIPLINWITRALGFEEKSFVGTVTQNFVPITRAIRKIPGPVLRFNPIASPLLWNPFNMSGKAAKTLLGKVVEPVPNSLQKSISTMISQGLACKQYGPELVKSMGYIRKNKAKFLFFYGGADVIAPPDTVLLAHEIITPNDSNNLIGVNAAGHVDLMIGENAREKVWLPTGKWLMENTSR